MLICQTYALALYRTHTWHHLQLAICSTLAAELLHALVLDHVQLRIFRLSIVPLGLFEAIEMGSVCSCAARRAWQHETDGGACEMICQPGLRCRLLLSTAIGRQILSGFTALCLESGSQGTFVARAGMLARHVPAFSNVHKRLQGIAWPFTAATIASNLFVALAADPMLRVSAETCSGMLDLQLLNCRQKGALHPWFLSLRRLEF